jgi:hypothetical protein
MPGVRAVALSAETHNRICRYAEIANVTTDQAVNDAVIEWMNSTGDLVIEALERRSRRHATKPKLILVSKSRVA